MPTLVHNPNGMSIGSAIFSQPTAERSYTLHWAALFPLKLPLPIVGCGPPSNTWFLVPTQVINPNGISIG